MPASPTAYSYVRFSHPDQAKGDSLRRQAQAAADWCKRNGVTLDTSTTLRDLGRSAYTGTHRTNPDRHALAAFLKLVEAGKVPRGSYLILENLDRLSREHIQPALLLALNLLQAGVRIVQLKPAEMVFDDRSDTLPVMMMMMELARGHGESAIKSERVGGAWREKKRRAQAGEDQKETKRMGKNRKAVTARLPAWIKLEDGKPVLIAERADVVRRVFRLSAAGHGLKSIVNLFQEEGVPPFTGRETYVNEEGDERYRAPAGAVLGSGKWFRSYLALILKDRRAVGEFQPQKTGPGGKPVPDGPPVVDYFPIVVTEREWQAARDAAKERGQRRRSDAGKQVNVFQGLLRNALGGGNYSVTQARAGSPKRALISAAATEGRGERRSFPFEPFEAAVLSLLREVPLQDVLGDDDKPDPVAVLSGQVSRVEAKIAELEAELADGDVAALARALRDHEAKKKDLDEKLAAARREAAHPLSEAWGQFKSLVELLDRAPDPQDLRLRIRPALRRVVSQVQVLVVARGVVRLCAVQVWFADGQRCRSYLIFSRPARSNGKARKDGHWWARSLASDAAEGDLDLRRPADAAKLAAALSAIDPDTLTGDESA